MKGEINETEKDVVVRKSRVKVEGKLMGRSQRR